jgi:Ni/Co efflux regulator RcnB
MSKRTRLKSRILFFALFGAIAAGPALADKPSWAGDKGGKDKGSEKHERNDQGRDESHGQDRDGRGDRNDDDGKGDRDRHDEDARGRGDSDRRVQHFGDQHRTYVRDYYSSHYKSSCPPGLRKKNNGCMPPGQAKKWRLGHQLPRDVIYHDVPHDLVVELGQPPRGYRYVRVAGDILMIAIGTAMIVDAIEDLGR